MTDEVLKELWATKEKIANEHGYKIDKLAEYFLQKQSTRHDKSYRYKRDTKSEQDAPLADVRIAR